MSTVVLENITKTYLKKGTLKQHVVAVENINLVVPNGRVTVFLGPSGCGKTTLLRIIAGTIKPTEGSIFFNGQDMQKVPPKDRRLGMVFQDFALYPSWNVKSNILAYFRFRKRSPELDEEAKQKYQRTSDLMGVDIAYLLDRSPKNLSPGEQQRVALARCITRDPALFLMDEPFTHLDQQLREKYRANLKRLLKEFSITTLYVTHDQHEALLLGDEIVMMRNGKIEQVDTYNNLHRLPKNVFVASFLNPNPLIPALNVQKGEFVHPTFAGKLLGIRPQDVQLDDGSASYKVTATIMDRFDLPAVPMTLLTTELNGETFYAYIPHPNTNLGQTIHFKLERFFVFDAKTERLLETYSG